MSTHLTVEEILARGERVRAADAKPGADVTEADLKHLSPERLSELMAAGELAHLGIGKPKPRGRYL